MAEEGAVDRIDQAMLRAFMEKREARDAAKVAYDEAQEDYDVEMELLWGRMNGVGVGSVRVTAWHTPKVLVATHRVYPKVSSDIDRDDAAAVARAMEIIVDFLAQVGTVTEPKTGLAVNLVKHLTVPEHVSLTKLGNKAMLQQVMDSGVPKPEVLDLSPKKTIQVRNA